MNRRVSRWPSWVSALPVLACLICVVPAALAENAGKVGTGMATATAQPGTWRKEQEAFAQIRAFREVSLAVPFPARVKKVMAEPGQKVRQGDVLARLEAPALRGLLWDVRVASGQLALERQGLCALRQMRRNALATTGQVIQGQIRVSRARAGLKRALTALDNALFVLGGPVDHKDLIKRLENADLDRLTDSLAVVRAPFAGVVAVRRAGEGGFLQAGETLFVLDDISRVYVEVGIPERALPDWKAGEAYVRLDGWKIPLYRTRAGALPDPSTGLWLLRYVSDNPGLVLQDGAWVRVVLIGPERNCVWVPDAAIVARRGKTYCVLAEEGGGFRAVVVKTGRAQGHLVPVLEGLDTGQKVVTRGAYELLYRDLNRLIRFVD